MFIVSGQTFEQPLEIAVLRTWQASTRGPLSLALAASSSYEHSRSWPSPTLTCPRASRWLRSSTAPSTRLPPWSAWRTSSVLSSCVPSLPVSANHALTCSSAQARARTTGHAARPPRTCDQVMQNHPGRPDVPRCPQPACQRALTRSRLDSLRHDIHAAATLQIFTS